MNEQIKELLCPRCGKLSKVPSALSRRDNKTEICSDCGTGEAVFDLMIHTMWWAGKKEKVKKLKKEERKWLKMPEKKEVIIWTGFKWTLEEGQTVRELMDSYHDGGITSYAIRSDKITYLEGNVLLEEEN